MELMMRDTLSGRNVSYEDLGDLEKTELRQMVQQFIAGEIALEDVSVRARSRGVVQAVACPVTSRSRNSSVILRSSEHVRAACIGWPLRAAVAWGH